MGRKRSAKATGSGFKEIPSSENLSLGERLSYMDRSKRGIVSHKTGNALLCTRRSQKN